MEILKTETMLRYLWISAILLQVTSGFVIHDICNQWVDDISIKVISSVPRNSKLIEARGSGAVSSLVGRLIENATSIRENIIDTFSCEGRVYGYYADQDNDCQIFHICVPMQQLFPEMYCAEDIFHFSFICPKLTVFSQEAMVCDWADNAFPCSEADKLYDRNNLLFVVPQEDVQRESSAVTTPSPTTKRPSLCCSKKTTPAPSMPKDKSPTTSVPSPSLPTTEKVEDTSGQLVDEKRGRSEDIVLSETVTPDSPSEVTSYSSTSPETVTPDSPSVVTSYSSTSPAPSNIQPTDISESSNSELPSSLQPSGESEEEISTVSELPSLYTELPTVTDSELLDTTLPLFLDIEAHTSFDLTPGSPTSMTDMTPAAGSATEPFLHSEQRRTESYPSPGLPASTESSSSPGLPASSESYPSLSLTASYPSPGLPTSSESYPSPGLPTSSESYPSTGLPASVTTADIDLDAGSITEPFWNTASTSQMQSPSEQRTIESYISPGFPSYIDKPLRSEPTAQSPKRIAHVPIYPVVLYRVNDGNFYSL